MNQQQILPTVEITSNAGYLDQYYKLRQRIFTEMYKKNRGIDRPSVYDIRGHICIARNGDTVIGGGRMILRNVGSDELLSMENEYKLNLENVFPEFIKGHEKIGELSTIVVDKEHRSMELYSELVRKLVLKAVSQNIRLGFSLATKDNSRLHLLLASVMNSSVKFSVQLIEDKYVTVQNDDGSTTNLYPLVLRW